MGDQRSWTGQGSAVDPPTTTMSDVVGAWTEASGHMLNSVTEVNRATLAAFGFGDTADGNGARDGSVPSDRLPGDASVAYSRADWSFDEEIADRDDLSVGDAVRFSKTLTDGDVSNFADASGDTNRLHLEESFARRTRFAGRIVHGTLVAGLISAALARLPGVTVYLSQDTRFLRPARIGSRVTATVEIIEELENDRFRLSTDVADEDDRELIEGEAVVLVDDVPDPEDGED